MANLREYNSPTGLKFIKKISDSILLIEYIDRQSLCKAFLRIEEYYESPKFKNKIFTLGEYREWYSKEYGTWSYYKDWSGFNIPSDAFNPFIKGLFDPLDASEVELVDLIKHKNGK